MKLTGMGFILTCDRPIDAAKHYISPGGFQISGKRFDFCQSAGIKVENDSRKIRFELKDLDTDYTDSTLTKTDVTNGIFDEFYVYTGEAGDEIINIISVSDIEFEFDYEDIISLTDDSLLTKSANEFLEQPFHEIEVDR